MINPVCERNPFFYSFIRTLSRFVLFPCFRIQTEGLETLPEKGPFVLLPKHQRWEDIPLLAIAIPRPLYYIAKHELFMNRASNRFISSLGGIPLNRKDPLKSRNSMRYMMEMLGKGEVIVIFPEGTYHKDLVGRGRTGLVRMILPRYSLPFIPVGINYSAEKGRKLVRIKVGRSIFGDSTVNSREFIDSIMKEVGRLSDLD